MKRESLKEVRRLLGISQREFAASLGISLKAVQSYEQGWRRIPDGVEKQVFFLLSRLNRKEHPGTRDCWKIKECAPALRKGCLAEELDAGDECWFVSGNRCDGTMLKSWREKRAVCFRCKAFLQQLKFIEDTPLYTSLLAAR
jgi:hypothetical protein